MRAAIDVEAAMAPLTWRSRAPNLRSGKKMLESSPGARHGVGARCQDRGEMCLERFRAQLRSTQMGNPGSRDHENTKERKGERGLN